MTRSLPVILGGLFALLVVITNSVFTVDQRTTALILQFGEAQRVINEPGKDEAGLHFMIPFVQQRVVYDRRNLNLAPADTREVVAADQERLEVDVFARWRISDPLRFYRAVRTLTVAEQRLEGLLDASMRRVLGAAQSNQIVSGGRAQLMAQIRSEMNRESAALGIEVVDVKIRRADLPQANSERVFARMEAEREQAAAQIRADGERRAQIIRAEADRERADILATAFGQDPEFASFYRSMQAYERSIQPGTTIVMTPQGDFFRYFDSQRGAGGNR